MMMNTRRKRRRQDQPWRRAPTGSCPPLGTLPVLVYDHGRGPNNRQTAFAIGDESLHTSVVPELANNYYHATPHGWVLLVAPGPSPRTRLWDPRSGESVPLPAMERGLPEDWECCLSDAPTAPSYIDRPCPEFPDGCNCLNEQLVESRGELFSVCICLKGFTPEILTVRAYRIDLMSGRPTLSKVDDLGDRVFLLSYTNVQLLCSASKYGVKGNRVYFNHNAMGDMDGRLLCVFDLDDQSLKTVPAVPGDGGASAQSFLDAAD
ncbi:hypothetical protein C2845_PM13G15540 [Panicum miliaceum]|uniref:KIB1-4 beta-propeller domain-containing protein n=1 Tax=Panicum miliaceum TaxID=4540 RepID=A0A3L6RJ56_PANMI|nr:hypothetical protein C2845_PM13G15540 [Panicum miliaceum]